jgi:hypothetical protein
MLAKLRSKLSYANVVATMALFAALGGGYAVAFSGSGSLQKGSDLGISSNRETIRSLTGIGSIQAQCQSDQVQVYFENKSGELLTAMGAGVTGGTVEQYGDNVGPGNLLLLFDAGESITTMDLHISPQDGTSRPQASVDITVNETPSCSTSTVRVLAVNTQG